LIQAAEQNGAERSWIITALGQLSSDAVRTALQGDPLLDQVQPFFHMSNQENWLASNEKTSNLRFLVAQNIH